MNFQRALITGGGTGIGRGLALALARRGCAVALASRRADVLASTAAAINTVGGRAVTLPVDLSQPLVAGALVGRAREALGGPLDVLVNNAGVMAPGRFEQTTPECIQQAVNVNLTVALTLTHAALPDLTATHGSLILVASQAALSPLPLTALYSATKAALRGFGEALRYELETSGVRLLVMYPPATDTAMTRPLTVAVGRQLPVAQKFLSLADPERIGEQGVTALERGQAECHWFGPQTLLTWLTQLWPGLVRRLWRAQQTRIEALLNLAASEVDGT